MPDRNVESLTVVYQKASELFQKLEEQLARYKTWMTLGLYEGSLDDLVEAHCTDATAFEMNMKVLKQKRKDADKLPSFIKVDCITVSLAPFKAALEDQYQKLTDALLYGMRRGAATRQKEVDEFLAVSMQTLAKRPQSVDEIGEAKRAWGEIVKAKEEFRGSHKKIEELSKLMRSVARTGVELSALNSRWEELELTLDAFNDRIEDQMQHLRGQMDGRVAALRVSSVSMVNSTRGLYGRRVAELQLGVQKFAARWFELKPKKLDTNKKEEMVEVISRVKEWRTEFDEVTKAAAKLESDCEHFQIAAPQLVRAALCAAAGESCEHAQL